MAFDFESVISAAAGADAADIILKSGLRPALKVDGAVRLLELAPPSAEELLGLIERLAPQDAFARLGAEGDCDFAVERGDAGRHRVNAFRHSRGVGMVLRQVKAHVPTFRTLHLPERQCTALSQLHRGLVLVTGVTGSGKSTTLASLMEAITTARPVHAVTLEDPVEFRFRDGPSVIHQREVGVNMKDWQSGLRAALREAPDVIMLGEIRDAASMEAALSAAETGHLVLSTLHTVNAIQTVERIMTFFPPHQHDLVRMQLSLVLEGVLSQRLVHSKATGRRVPALEILLPTPRVRELLRQGKTRDLDHALVDGASQYGTQTFNMALKALVDGAMVEESDAIAASDNPDDLRLALRGISRGTERRLAPSRS
jgi:twitching motility protein PilT